MDRKLVVPLACRNLGTRLYGKPMQNLDIEKRYSILEYMIDSIKTYDCVTQAVLAIAEGPHNLSFVEFAERNGIPYILGEEKNVLQRLILATEFVEGTDILHLTSESPFMYFEALEEAWQSHVDGGFDITALDNLPDGAGFELIKLSAYKKSHDKGDDRHRAEFCSLYIRENKSDFLFNYVEIPEELRRLDIRLTVDYPEDLIFCRAIYNEFQGDAPRIPLKKIINFIDRSPQLANLVKPFIEEGLKTMYL